MEEKKIRKPTPPQDLPTLQLLELVCQLHSRSFMYPTEEMHNAYFAARMELESRLSQPAAKEPTNIEKKQIEDFMLWLTEVWSKSITIPFYSEASGAYLKYKSSKEPTDLTKTPCYAFDPDNTTSSATKCKCGKEKWEHSALTKICPLPICKICGDTGRGMPTLGEPDGIDCICSKPEPITAEALHEAILSQWYKDYGPIMTDHPMDGYTVSGFVRKAMEEYANQKK